MEKFNTCSQCPQTVTIESPQYLECVATLERLFPSTSEDATPGAVEVTSEDGSQTISVVMLGGDSTVVKYKPQMTIQALKSFIQSRLGPPPQKQRLLCNEKELKVTHLILSSPDLELSFASLQSRLTNHDSDLRFPTKRIAFDRHP